jgi:hypothetical protein
MMLKLGCVTSRCFSFSVLAHKLPIVIQNVALAVTSHLQHNQQESKAVIREGMDKSYKRGTFNTIR